MWKVSCAQSSHFFCVFFFWLGVLTVCIREKSAFLLVVLTNVLPERPKFFVYVHQHFLEKKKKKVISHI